jgi:hypothetical protein
MFIIKLFPNIITEEFQRISLRIMMGQLKATLKLLKQIKGFMRHIITEAPLRIF